MNEEISNMRKKFINIHKNSKLFEIPKKPFYVVITTKRSLKYENNYNILYIEQNCLHFHVLLNWTNSSKNIFQKVKYIQNIYIK